MLWAGILFVWELVGVDLNKAVATGGNIGTIVNSIKSPQAVPWALLILVLYFLFKCSIEWAQCHVDRRRVLFARIDFVSAWFLSVAAIALYIGQAISHVQFADLLQDPNKRWPLAFGVVSGIFFVMGIFLLSVERFRPGFEAYVALVLGIAPFILGFIILKVTGIPLRWAYWLIGVSLGGGVQALTLLALKQPFLRDWLKGKRPLT